MSIIARHSTTATLSSDHRVANSRSGITVNIRVHQTKSARVINKRELLNINVYQYFDDNTITNN